MMSTHDIYGFSIGQTGDRYIRVYYIYLKQYVRPVEQRAQFIDDTLKKVGAVKILLNFDRCTGSGWANSLWRYGKLLFRVRNSMSYSYIMSADIDEEKLESMIVSTGLTIDKTKKRWVDERFIDEYFRE